MENLTHSLLGATFAELALPAAATPAQRRLFFTVGVIAANLPDADLLYTRITAPPLGYLLHHRGHTHTLVGIVVQAAIVGVICMLPAIRSRVGTARTRFWTLISVALLSHLLADSWNSYGVHPFWPLDNRWLYGDAIYILEPWLWLFLGIAATLNAHRSRARLLLGALLAGLVVTAFVANAITTSAAVALTIGGAALALVMSKLASRRRSMLALALASSFVATMFGVSRVVESRVVAASSLGAGDEIVDVILNPQPANPVCWSALSIVKNERADRYVMTRGSIRLSSLARCGMRGDAGVEWDDTTTQALGAIRTLDRTDCRVSAWLQFGRAPLIGDGELGDLRFGGRARGNFTSMPLRSGDACPSKLTNWSQPRADLL